jgi:hypothetical protein
MLERAKSLPSTYGCAITRLHSVSFVTHLQSHVLTAATQQTGLVALAGDLPAGVVRAEVVESLDHLQQEVAADAAAW